MEECKKGWIDAGFRIISSVFIGMPCARLLFLIADKKSPVRSILQILPIIVDIMEATYLYVIKWYSRIWD